MKKKLTINLFFFLLTLVFLSPVSVNAQGGITCTECTRTVTSNTGTVTVNPNETVCLNSPNFTGNIVINGGTLKICGTAAPSNISYNNGSNQATIINNNSLTLRDFSANGNVTLINNSILRFPNNLNLRGVLNNNQFVEVGGDVNVNPGGSLNNIGFFQVRGNFNNNDQVFNEGTMDIRGNLTNNSTGRFVNNLGNTFVAGNLINSGAFINRARVDVGGTTQINSGGVLSLGFLDQPVVLNTQNLGVDGRIQGNGISCSSIRVSNRTIINSSAVVSGRVDICDANGIEANNGRIEPPATTNCSCQLSATAARSSFSTDENAVEEKSLIAYPSPFSASLSIEYKLKESSEVSLFLYNSSGEKVKDVILNVFQNEGDHVANFSVSELASGIYIYVLQTGKEYKSGKVVKK